MNVSPWLRYHTTVAQTLSLALWEVRQRAAPGATVYLCGGINGLSDSACRDWRETAKQALHDFRILDPMRRDYRGREDEAVSEIIDGDKEDILRSDVLLVNASRPSWGTAMEVMFAWVLRFYLVRLFLAITHRTPVGHAKRIVAFLEIA